MNVVALQLDIVWESKRANFEKVSRLLAAAAPEPGSVVVLPEMFATGFSMNTEACAEPPGGETTTFLSNLAREFRICLIAGAAIRGRHGQVCNKALVFSSAGELLAFYSKMRPFTPGGEAAHCVAGQRPLVFEWNGCRISTFICYDLRFPELFRQVAATRQPELFVVMANWPAKRISHWLKLLPARAIENQAFVIGVNRVGADPACAYNGRSLILDPQGDILVDAGEHEGCIQASLDLAGLREYRERLPFLQDLKAGPL